MNEATQMPMAEAREMGLAGSIPNQAAMPPKSWNALAIEAEPSNAMAGTAMMERMVRDLMP